MEQPLREGYAHFRDGRWQAAGECAARVLAAQPDQVAALALQGLVFAAQGQAHAAEPCFRRLTALQPQIAEHWINLGMSLRSLGEWTGALAALMRAERLGAAHPEFLCDLAASLIDAGQVEAAQPRLRALLARYPRHPRIRVQLARAAIEAAATVEAREWMQQAEARLDEAPDLLGEAGAVWLQIGEPARAEALLQRALAAQAQDPDLLARLALLYERTNRVDEAEKVLQRAGTADSHDLQQARARLAARRGQHAQAIGLYRGLVQATPAPGQQQAHWFELGKLHDACGDAPSAMQAFDRAHACKRAAARAVPHHDLLRILDFASAPADVAQWRRPPADGQPDPVFVVGFPRSGTTLLEQILDAHPALCAMDEQPFLQRAIDRLLQRGAVYPERMAALDEEALRELRAAYFADVGRVAALQPGQRLVDKNPLNLMRLPAIRRLFPDAAVILALRHPLDVVLSCYMQPFRAPAFSRLCDSLDSTAATYARMMQAFLDERARLPGALLEWRYEDLLDDYRGEVERLLAWLGLDWAPALDDLAAQARRRGFISTPSYSQVVEPLNRRGLDRWQRYRAWLQPLAEPLASFMQRWNYKW